MGAAAVPIALAVASTAATVYNTRRTEKKQDQALAQSIRNRGKEQSKIDERVNQQLAEVAASTSADEARAARNSYSDALRNNRRNLESGLTPTIGSEAFQSTAAQRLAGVDSFADTQAGLMSRLDAPLDQRRGEANSTGRFGEDLDIARRFSQGNAYLDDLRLRSIRRNPWIDAAAQLAMGYAGGMGGGASGASTGSLLNANASAQGGMANGYYVPPRW